MLFTENGGNLGVVPIDFGNVRFRSKPANEQEALALYKEVVSENLLQLFKSYSLCHCRKGRACIYYG